MFIYVSEAILLRRNRKMVKSETGDDSKIHKCDLITAQKAHKMPGSAESGLFLRKQTVGPEKHLVVEYLEEQLPLSPRGQRRTIFVEPRIDSGFPDAVVVYWNLSTAMHWTEARRHLTKIDIRIAHFLALSGARSTEELQPFFSVNINRCLERLTVAGLVRRTAQVWRLRSLKEIFAVRRLIAIEAKMENWRDGLDQAFQNTWFSSESYLLLPQMPKAMKLRQRSRSLGVGIRTRKQWLDSLEDTARIDRIPKSYASWLFNEWVWRIAMFE
jgi:hypothetical protein